MELISPAYKALLTEKHDNKPWGGAGSSWAPIIAPYLNILPMGASVLDFGCGRATFKPAILELRPDLRVEEYDPGVRGKDVLPHERFDYVVCTDVMEHVEEQFVDNTLDILAFLCKLGIFFNIDCGLSKSLLPDGTNTHITVKPSLTINFLYQYTSNIGTSPSN